MHTGEGWRLGHRPALDGVRGIAFLLVFVSHLWWPVRAWGTAGVTVFFTLSGFLITTLLLEELHDTGRIRFGRFYQRRAVRLLPALVVFLAVALLIGAASFAGVAVSLGYMSNWAIAFDLTEMDLIGHTWSLSIEEQFYLAWPVLLLALIRYGSLAWLVAACGAGILYAWVARAMMWDGGDGAMRVYMGFDTRADSLLVGCALAALMHQRPAVGTPRWVPRLDLLAVAVIAATVALMSGPVADYLLLPAWLPLATAGLILMSATSSVGLLASRPLRWLGRRSYALYLWHGLPIHMVSRIEGLPVLAEGVIAAVATALLAELSWRLVEAPAQRWYRNRSVRAVETPGLPGRSGREDPTRPHAERVSSRV